MKIDSCCWSCEGSKNSVRKQPYLMINKISKVKLFGFFFLKNQKWIINVLNHHGISSCMRSIYRQLFNNISKSINTSECDHLRILSIKLTSSVFFIFELRWCLAINNGPSFSFFTALMNGLFLREWWIDSSTFNLIKIHRFYYFFFHFIHSICLEWIH